MGRYDSFIRSAIADHLAIGIAPVAQVEDWRLFLWGERRYVRRLIPREQSRRGVTSAPAKLVSFAGAIGLAVLAARGLGMWLAYLLAEFVR